MRFLAKIKEKQMQKRLGGALFGLLCAGMLVMPSAWAAGGQLYFFGTDGKTKQLTGAKVSLDTGSYLGIYGGYNDDKPGQRVYKNQITLTGNTNAYRAYGGYSEDGDAAENTVSITNMDNFNGEVFGGCSINGDAAKNTVSISGSTVNNYVLGGSAYKESVNNTVNIKDSTINGGVDGGWAFDGLSEKNIVNISASKVSYNVYGGYTENHSAVDTITIDNNTVALQNGTIVKGTVYGAFVVEGKVTHKNNTLEIAGVGNMAGNVKNFDNFNFVVDNTVSYSDTMLTITGRGTSAAANNLTVNNDKLNVKVVNPEKLIAAEATTANKIITLIDNKAGVINGFIGTKDVSVTAGALLTYDGEVSLTDSDKKLTLKIGNFKEFTPEAKSLVETRAAAGFVVNNMADFMQSTGMEQARAAAFEGDKELAPFAAIGGSKMRYETGSYVDVNGWNGALGIAKKAGDMTYGIALEHGKGSYDSYLDSGAHADGDIKSTGGVIFGELKQDNGVHFDAALRAGRVKSDYQSATTSYDESSTYYGFSLGGGKEIAMNDKAALDLYGRFYYTHTNSSDTTASSGEKLAFDAVNSQRIRLGGRYTVDMNDNSQAYAGLAWQYEFGGDAKAAINGCAAPTPSLKGHSGIVEAGYKLNAGKNLMLDFNLNGAFGKQRGFGGALAAQWQF